jgi:hypothetical protein
MQLGPRAQGQRGALDDLGQRVSTKSCTLASSVRTVPFIFTTWG